MFEYTCSSAVTQAQCDKKGATPCPAAKWIPQIDRLSTVQPVGPKPPPAPCSKPSRRRTWTDGSKIPTALGTFIAPVSHMSSNPPDLTSALRVLSLPDGDPSHAELRAAFDALPRNARRQALLLLFSQLDNHEWRAAHSTLSTKRFQYDIIGQLPPELLIQVFSHTHPTLPFALQRVSRKWREKLRSPAILKPVLQSVHGRTINLENYDDCLRKALNIHSFHQGKPRAITTIHPSRDFDLPLRKEILVEDFLVGVDKTERAMISHNLRTSKSWHMFGAGREKICKIAASTELVAFVTTSNICHVADLAGINKKYFKLFGGMFEAIDCHGSTVACAGVFAEHVDVYIWDFNYQHGKSLNLGRNQAPFTTWKQGCPTPPIALVLASDCQSVSIYTSQRCRSISCPVCIDSNDATECSIYMGRFTFEGQLTYHDDMELSVDDDRLPVGISFNSLSLHDRNGEIALAIVGISKVSDVPHDGHEPIDYEFDLCLHRDHSFLNTGLHYMTRGIRESPATIKSTIKRFCGQLYEMSTYKLGDERRPGEYMVAKLESRVHLLAKPVILGTASNVVVPLLLLTNDQFAVWRYTEYLVDGDQTVVRVLCF
ncbi:unnamed protein product [Periconia digitata]|uniref:F-box domain-containing protein n=1 Tax=Periconia digitata TaxID=1303443 RepID=A0A9W4XW77_9PLEO|nr:unnamed protein product [Periconia digitata]